VTTPLFMQLHELDRELGRMRMELAELERSFSLLRLAPPVKASLDFLRAYV
jgi:hypothetical protein